MPISDRLLRISTASTKPKKLSDGGGLQLLVQPTGSKLWRLAYRFAGKQKTLALGIYPAVSLADARSGRDQAKKLLAKGIDPSAQRKLDREIRKAATENSFR